MVSTLQPFAMDISVLIVTYNSAGFARGCIESVLRQEGVEFEIIVVDNHSPDNTVQVLRELGDAIRLVESPENLGFGRGNNLAFQSSRGRYLFLLNPDASFVSPRTLQDAVRWMSEHPECGIAGTAIDRPGDPARPKHGYHGQEAAGRDFSKLPGTIAWVVGASMIIRRDVYEAVKGFDEDFFMYGEEADLCLRAREAGFQIGYCENILVRHVGGQSESDSPVYDVWRRREDGKHVFYRKHYAPDVVRRLVADRLRMARFRLFWLGLKSACGILSGAGRRQREKYLAVRDAGRDFLAGFAAPEAGNP